MTSGAVPNIYYDVEMMEREVAQNHHRDVIGGLWEEIGKLQFEFLRANGLAPTSRLIDIGCGCLRGGIYFVDYLDPGNYFGMDISEELLNAGYDVELRDRCLQEKLPRANLIADGEFQFAKFPVTFDFGIAQSIFSHLPAEHIRLCLSRLAPRMEPGGILFGTFFLVPDDHPSDRPFEHPQGVQTFEQKDPFHYRFGQVRALCDGLPWQPVLIGDWGHPRDQQMVRFRFLAS